MMSEYDSGKTKADKPNQNLELATGLVDVLMRGLETASKDLTRKTPEDETAIQDFCAWAYADSGGTFCTFAYYKK